MVRDDEQEQIDAIIAMVEADPGQVEVQGNAIMVTRSELTLELSNRS